MNWIRVSKNLPCPICKHIDWCLISPNGHAVICPRTSSANKLGEMGYIHILEIPVLLQNNGGSIIKRTTIDFGALIDFYHRNLPIWRGLGLAKGLGIDWGVLWDFSTGWDGEAYTIPMYDEFWRPVGIHRRFPDGSKSCVKGSHNGVFISCATKKDFYNLSNILVCEGWSDTAMAESLGFRAVGKFNSTCGGNILKEILIGKKVLIVADNDPAGKKSAENLKIDLTKLCKCDIIYPDIKDLRETVKIKGIEWAKGWLKQGLNILNNKLKGDL